MQSEAKRGQNTFLPLAGGSLAAMLGCLGKRLYDWQPETELDKALKGIGLVVGGAYRTHLFVDAFSARSLPLLGK